MTIKTDFKQEIKLTTTRKKLVFLIRSLDIGGAQRQLIALTKALNKKNFEITVLTFYSGGELGEELKDHEINLISLEKGGRWDIWKFFWRMIHQLNEIKPDVLHGYLSTANIFTVLLKPLFPRTKMVWGVRASNIDLSRYDWLVRVSFKLECWLSPLADLIIVNSKAGKIYHIDHGFPSKKMAIIPNGIDTEYFQPDNYSRIKLRQEWKISDDIILIGLVGRLDPIKDHPTFLKAAALSLKERQDIRWICVGSGSDKYTQELYQLAEDLRISEQVIWAGAKNNMPAVYNALDIACCCSYGEGFPNVVGEAMACGIPCVVTDVGDCAWIVGDTGIVVPPQNPQALVSGWKYCLERDRKEIAIKSRERIRKNFTTNSLAQNTEVLLGQL
ncbi:MAG TPA: group 1 glycosyl transferase [Cyanothece sp. UBA12306]|nr:group 1 glycosyl transferase [Cyanothece sp. UBA12306]